MKSDHQRSLPARFLKYDKCDFKSYWRHHDTTRLCSSVIKESKVTESAWRKSNSSSGDQTYRDSVDIQYSDGGSILNYEMTLCCGSCRPISCKSPSSFQRHTVYRARTCSDYVNSLLQFLTDDHAKLTWEHYFWMMINVERRISVLNAVCHD